jgi:dipeptidyl aminopeptidase/acylaminoacyl peptidase
MKRLLISLFALSIALGVAAADDVERLVSTMARTGFAGAPSFSPDGKRVAFLSNMSGSPQVWIVSSDGGWPDQVTALDDPVERVDWSPDGKWLALQIAPGGGLNSQIWVVRPDGTGLRKVVGEGKENNWFDLWTPDSKSLVFSSNRRDGAFMDSVMVGVDGGEPRLLAKNPGIGSIAEISEDGKQAILYRLRSRGDDDFFRLTLDDSQETLLTKHTPPATFNSADFSAVSNEIFVAGNPDRDRSAFGRVKIAADGSVSPFETLVSRDDAELAGFVLNEQETVAALNWNVAGRSQITLLDLKTMKERPVNVPGDIIGIGEFSADGTKLALTASGSNAPSDIWVLDVASGNARQITRVPHAGIDLAQLVRPELVTYKAPDGLTLTGWLYRPKDAKAPYPTVFSFHGGPEGQERPNFNSTYQALVANGIAVFAPNVRGSSGFGKRFVNLDNGALRVGSVSDIKASTDHLVKSGIADPKRLGIMGGSYGGYMVMAGVTEYPDLFAAGANLFGVVNFETFFKHSEPWMAAISTIEYGNPATEAAMLRSLSPIHKVDRVKTPLLVLHGANDTNVPVIEAEQVVDSLKKRNVPVEYILFPDEGHGWRKTPNRIRSAVAIVNFFRKHLGG